MSPGAGIGTSAFVGPGMLASYFYDDLGRRTALFRGNGAVTQYAWDPVSRLASQADDLAGPTNDQVVNFAYNPASQIVTRTGSNDLYAWTGHGSGGTASVADGLNRVVTIAGGGVGYDARGNLTIDPTIGRGYGYWSENEMVATSDGYGFGHDTFGRIINTLTNSVVVSYFVHDGNEMITAFDATGLAGRYVRGDGADELIAWYEGTGTATRRWAHADERGSVVAVSDGSGAAIAINRYDEYGRPAATNLGRFQYTGQMWLPEVGLYHYKARVFAPHLGRFLQTDPIGYDGGINLYAYVGNDPVNSVDPLGLEEGPNPHVKPINPWVAPPTGCLVNAECGIAGGMSGNWPVSNGVGGAFNGGEASGSGGYSGGAWDTYRRDVYSDGSRGSWQYVGSSTGWGLGALGLTAGGAGDSGNEIKLACSWRLSAVCREIARTIMTKIISKPGVPALPPGVSAPQFGKAAGFVQGFPTTPVTPSMVQQGMANLKGLGVTRNMVSEWRNFYQTTAVRDIGNPSAAWRANLLGQIERGW